MGTSWYYTEKFTFGNEDNEDYIKFESVKDTMYAGKNCRKIIKRHEVICNDRPWIEYMYEENGKVYFYDPNFYGFQVLYDFNTNQNDTWTIFIEDYGDDIDTLLVVVDSTKIVAINGVDLKKLYVTYNFIHESFMNETEQDTMIYQSVIIERIGDLTYMFNYVPEWSAVCDANYSDGLRCYEDSIVGLFETGLADSCDYRKYFFQDLMTIREVFDFEIGDVFHLRGESDSEPPNADRITITGKYYSYLEDTLFYIRYHDSYYTTIEPLEYHFWTKTDTVFFTYLDSTLTHYNQFEYFDFDSYYSNLFCDSLINTFETIVFDPSSPSDRLKQNFGRGLGITKNFKYNGIGQTTDYNKFLFYYKKSSGSCGNPDTTVSIGDVLLTGKNIEIFPIPTKRYLTIRSLNPNMVFKTIQLFDFSGREIQIYLDGNQIDLGQLPEGIYVIRLALDNGQTIMRKIIKK